jgi:autotransporter-associated beta strand protein
MTVNALAAHNPTGGIRIKAGTITWDGGINTTTGSAVPNVPVTLGDSTLNADVTFAQYGRSNFGSAVSVLGSGSHLMTFTNNNTGNVVHFLSSPASFALNNNDITFSIRGLQALRMVAGTSVTGTGNVIIANTNSGVWDLRGTTGINNVGEFRNVSTGTGGIVQGAAGSSFGPNVTAIVQNSATAGFSLGQANGTFVGAAKVLAGSLYVDNTAALSSANEVDVASGGTLDVHQSNTIAGLSDVSGAGGTVTNSGAADTVLTVSSGSNYSFSGAISNGATNKIGMSKSGAGTQTLSGNLTYGGPTTVNAGTLRLGNSLTGSSSVTVNDGSLVLASNGSNLRVIKTPSVSIPGPTGKIDLQDNKLITATTAGTWNGSSYSGVTGLIATGKGTGNLWDGATGIVTSQSNAIGSNYHSIGVARASDVRPNTATETALWAGQTITGTDTLVMYTYGGDANLDGKINIDDYIKIDSGIATGLTGWSNGDFNYDGKINIDDYTQFVDANIGTQGAQFPTAGGLAGDLGGGAIGVSAVPEPATLSIMGLAALYGMQRGVMRRQRRLSARRATRPN